MTLQDFLSSEQASLPKKRGTGDFSRFYETITDAYLEALNKLAAVGTISTRVKKEISVAEEIRSSVLSSIRHHLDGQPALAYQEVEKMAGKHQTLFKELVSDRTHLETFTLFRLRKLETGKVFSRSDLFHIPFEKRHLVHSQRYSIPGFPSLYMSSSVYTAWKELLCPDLNSVAVARIEPMAGVKYLSFPLPPQYFGRNVDLNHLDTLPATNPYHNFLSTQILTWPLLAACSIQVLERDAPFKPEYIVPQLVLQLLRNDVFGADIYGIRYFSLHFGRNHHSLQLGSNFVFPVRQSNPDGHCPILKGLFKITEPVSWQVATLVDEEFNKLKTSGDSIELIPGNLVSNQLTHFARVEVKLIDQPAAAL